MIVFPRLLHWFLLTLVTFIGEVVREAFDPKNFQLMNKMKKLKH